VALSAPLVVHVPAITAAASCWQPRCLVMIRPVSVAWAAGTYDLPDGRRRGPPELRTPTLEPSDGPVRRWAHGAQVISASNPAQPTTHAARWSASVIHSGSTILGVEPGGSNPVRLTTYATRRSAATIQSGRTTRNVEPGASIPYWPSVFDAVRHGIEPGSNDAHVLTTGDRAHGPDRRGERENLGIWRRERRRTSARPGCVSSAATNRPAGTTSASPGSTTVTEAAKPRPERTRAEVAGRRRSPAESWSAPRRFT
jgi:hypothetical protein